MKKEDKEKSAFSRLHHISIVVRDVDAAVSFYESIGIGPFEDYPPMGEYVKISVPDEEGFYHLKIKCAQIGSIQLQLVQPGQGDSLYIVVGDDLLDVSGPGNDGAEKIGGESGFAKDCFNSQGATRDN